MAALDPTQAPEADDNGNIPAIPRSTLRLVKPAFPGLDDDEGDEDDEWDKEYMKAMLNSSDDEDEDEEEVNGGPSDPAKSQKQRKAAALKDLIAATKDSDEADLKPNGVKGKKSNDSKKGKGKGKAKLVEEEEVEMEDEDEEDEDDDDDEDDESDDEANLEDYVVCTLDTERVSPVNRSRADHHLAHL